MFHSGNNQGPNHTEQQPTQNTNSIEPQQLESEAIPSFDLMGLDDNLLRGIYGYGYEKPSMIQQKAIVPLYKGGDLIAQAQSGTGKTGAFVIGTIQKLDFSKKHTQAIILSPTRELARQTYKVMSSIGDYQEVRCTLLVGGTKMQDCIADVKSGAHVVIGTPGRIMDMIERQFLDTRSISIFVIDEADEMLSKGFEEQVRAIMARLPEQAQVALFSATMPEECLALTRCFMNNPLHILVKAEEVTLDGIRQFYIDVDREEWKLDVLCDLYETLTVAQAVIFCSSRRKVDWLQQQLEAREHTVSAIHSDMDERDRVIIMEEFRSGSSRILISTDLLARGIDVQQISLVVNYDMPRGENGRENYIHRIGRGGRFGRKGVAINLVTHTDVGILRELERFYSTKNVEMPADVANLM